MPVLPVFIVHGSCSKKKGEALASVIEPWVQFPGKNLGRDKIHLEVTLRPDRGPAHATLRFEDETWEIWEAYREGSFHPLDSFQVLAWSFKILRDHTVSILRGMFPQLRRNSYLDSSDPVYMRHPRSSLAKVYDLIVGSAAIALILVFYPLALFAATAIFVISQLPLGLVSIKLKKVTVTLTHALVQGPGDMAAILLSETQLASIKSQLTELLQTHVSASTSPPDGLERATVIAHSAGTVVAYAVLSDPSLWDAWARDAITPKSISLLTVGSALNLAWRADRHHPIWARPLDERIRWIDFWSRYDPVTHGPAMLKVKDRVRGKGTGVFENVRVVNQDSPFSDHTTYWGNQPEVVSRIIYEIAAVTPRQQTLWDSIKRRLYQIPQHRSRVGKAALMRTLGPTLLLGTLVLLELFTTIDPASSVGRYTLGLILPNQQEGGGGWGVGLRRNPTIEYATGMAVFCTVFYALWQGARLWINDPTLSKRYRHTHSKSHIL